MLLFAISGDCGGGWLLKLDPSGRCWLGDAAADGLAGLAVGEAGVGAPPPFGIGARRPSLISLTVMKQSMQTLSGLLGFVRAISDMQQSLHIMWPQRGQFTLEAKRPNPFLHFAQSLRVVSHWDLSTIP